MNYKMKHSVAPRSIATKQFAARFYTFLAAGFVCMFAACNNPPYRDPGSSRGSVETAYHQWRNAMGSIDPGAATARGDHRFDTQLEPCSKELLSRVRELLQRAKADLVAIEGVALTPEADADRELMLGRVEADLFLVERLRPFERDPLWTLQIVSRALASLENAPGLPAADRADAFVKRLNAIPAYLMNSRNVAISPSQVHATIATELGDALLEYLGDGIVKTMALDSVAGAGDALGAARNAMIEHRAWLNQVIATGPNGWHHKTGRRDFEFWVHAESGLNLTADQVAELASRELEGSRAAFFASAKAAYPSVENSEEAAKHALVAISDARALDGDALAPMTQIAADQARAVAADGAFATVPAGFGVRAASGSSVRTGSGYTSGTLALGQGAAWATFKVAAPLGRLGAADRVDWYSTISPLRLRLAAFEEVAPGKAFAAALRSENRSPIRRDVAAAAFELGWGDYARRNAAIPAEPLEKVVMAHEDMLVAMRALVSTRIHAGTMSVAEATDLFRRQCMLGGGESEREARRCAADPMLALELVGRVEIEKIVDELRQKRGLSRGPVNNLILQKGALPLSSLRKLLL